MFQEGGPAERGVEDRAGGQPAFFLVQETVTIMDSEQQCKRLPQLLLL